MKRGEWKYLAVFLAMLAFVVWANVNLSETVWEVTLDSNDNRAYGSEIVYEALPHIVGQENVVQLDAPPYTILADTTLQHTTYLFLTDQFASDNTEWEAMIDYVDRGNVVFISAVMFNDDLVKTIGVNHEVDFWINESVTPDSAALAAFSQSFFFS